MAQSAFIYIWMNPVGFVLRSDQIKIATVVLWPRHNSCYFIKIKRGALVCLCKQQNFLHCPNLEKGLLKEMQIRAERQLKVKTVRLCAVSKWNVKRLLVFIIYATLSVSITAPRSPQTTFNTVNVPPSRGCHYFKVRLLPQHVYSHDADGET